MPFIAQSVYNKIMLKTFVESYTWQKIFHVSFQWVKRIGDNYTRNNEILATPKNIQILYVDLKKTLKCIEMTPKLAKFCDDPQKISTKSSYPQKIFIFLKTPKNIEIQNFDPKKCLSLRMCENIRVPHLEVPYVLNQCVVYFLYQTLIEGGNCSPKCWFNRNKNPKENYDKNIYTKHMSLHCLRISVDCTTGGDWSVTFDLKMLDNPFVPCLKKMWQTR